MLQIAVVKIFRQQNNYNFVESEFIEIFGYSIKFLWNILFRQNSILKRFKKYIFSWHSNNFFYFNHQYQCMRNVVLHFQDFPSTFYEKRNTNIYKHPKTFSKSIKIYIVFRERSSEDSVKISSYNDCYLWSYCDERIIRFRRKPVLIEYIFP